MDFMLRLGGRFKAGISGGGALPGKVDHFFNAVGIRLQEGYGLTETSPIISVRQYKKSRRGTIGQCIVAGQDQKYLAALIVPVQEAVMAFAEENNIPIVDWDFLLQQPEIIELMANDIADLVSAKAGFKTFERNRDFFQG
jgi:long-subunit acyl-CoA synthetase (AMP-forming)